MLHPLVVGAGRTRRLGFAAIWTTTQALFTVIRYLTLDQRLSRNIRRTVMCKKAIWLALLIGVTFSSVTESEEKLPIPEDFIGTWFVNFHVVKNEGQLTACSLEFKAIFKDYVYRNGDAEIATGSIALMKGEKRDAGIYLKLGTKSVINSEAPLEAPSFAYLETKNGSTSSAGQVALDGDPGYKLFLYGLVQQGPAKAAIADLFTENEVGVRFNRLKKGMDVLVPIDLTVSETVMEAGYIKRKHSTKAVEDFRTCSFSLLDSLKNN